MENSKNNRRHYRVAKKEIYVSPEDGIYVTKEEFGKFALLSLAFMFISFLISLLSCRK